MGLAVAVQAGCAPSPPPADLLAERTMEGQVVQSLVAKDRPSVILYYPSSYCFSCGQEVNEWLNLDRAGDIKLVVLLADKPSNGARRSLAARRIPVAGTLEWSKRRPAPQEILVDGGVATIIARGGAQTGKNSPILAAIRTRVRPPP